MQSKPLPFTSILLSVCVDINCVLLVVLLCVCVCVCGYWFRFVLPTPCPSMKLKINPPATQQQLMVQHNTCLSAHQRHEEDGRVVGVTEASKQVES